MPLMILILSFLLTLIACSTTDETSYTSHTSSNGPVGIAIKEVNAYGKVIKVEAYTNRITIKHAPIPELNWGPMLMSFQVIDDIDLSLYKKNDLVDFVLEFDKNDHHRIKSLSHK